MRLLGVWSLIYMASKDYIEIYICTIKYVLIKIIILLNLLFVVLWIKVEETFYGINLISRF